MEVVRRNSAAGKSPVCARPTLRTRRALIDLNSVEVVDPAAPDIAVVVLGDVPNPLRSPPLDEQLAAAEPRHVVDLTSEEDVGVEAPPADVPTPLTDHNYEVSVKVEADEMLSDVEDGGGPGRDGFSLSRPTLVHMKREEEDVEVDVEYGDDVEAAMSALFGESPADEAASEPPAIPSTPGPAVKAEQALSPDTVSAPSEAGSSPTGSSREPLRPGWRECPICGTAVMGIMGYRDHMLARHMSATPYRCLDCRKTFALARDLIRHTNNHCAEVFYKCQRCDRTWSSDRHHAACAACEAAVADGPEDDKDDGVYECDVCSRTFPLLRHLTAHVKTHPDVVKPFKCHTCGQRFNQSVRLMIHVRSHMLSPSKRSAATTRARAPATSATPATPSPSPSPVAKRARSSGGSGGGAGTPRSSLPGNHIAFSNFAFSLKMEPPEPHSDDEFGEHSGVLNDDDFHDDIFGDADDDGNVEDMDYEDQDDDDAREEMMDAEGAGDANSDSPKRYKCKWCTRTFRFSHQVGVHMRTHTDERPYHCRLCDHSFRQSNHLKRHLCGSHGLIGAAANQAFRSMLALKRRRQQRERFRALTAFFAKQGGFKGFGPADADAAEVERLINRGFARDLSGRAKMWKKTRDESMEQAKPWVNLDKVNGPASAAAPSGLPAPSPAKTTPAPSPAKPPAPVPSPAKDSASAPSPSPAKPPAAPLAGKTAGATSPTKLPSAPSLAQIPSAPSTSRTPFAQAGPRLRLPAGVTQVIPRVKPHAGVTQVVPRVRSQAGATQAVLRVNPLLKHQTILKINRVLKTQSVLRVNPALKAPVKLASAGKQSSPTAAKVPALAASAPSSGRPALSAANGRPSTVTIPSKNGMQS